MFAIGRVHEDLVVSRIGVHETEQLVTDSCIHKLVYPRQRKTVLWTSLVQVGIVLTHSPSAIALPNHDRVRKPDRVRGFPDKADGFKLVNFGTHGLVLFGIIRASLLSDRLIGRGDAELVADDVWGYVGHVVIRPGEDVSMVPQEVNELHPEEGLRVVPILTH
ncbi:unnamed protein product [Prunus brigantina]